MLMRGCDCSVDCRGIPVSLAEEHHTSSNFVDDANLISCVACCTGLPVSRAQEYHASKPPSLPRDKPPSHVVAWIDASGQVKQGICSY
jgi:hypothetical protein